MEWYQECVPESSYGLYDFDSGRHDASPSPRSDSTPSRPRGPLSLSSPLASYLLTTSPGIYVEWGRR